MENVDKPTILMLTGLLHDYGVRHIVVSSGSRCAPLTVALNRSGFFGLHPVIDERTAAFVGLGMALATGEPVALVCTSGSAPLNYAPAMAEAFYRRIPLIAISADRPWWWVGQREGQTIRQAGALDAVTRAAVDLLPDNGSARMDAVNNRIINDVLTKATKGIRGPVHINVQIAEPLTPMAEAPAQPMWHRINTAELQLELQGLPKHTAGERVLVVVGGVRLTDAERAAIEHLNCLDGVVVVAEAQTNIRHAIRPALVDTRLSDDLRPDKVIVIGGDMVSNRFKAWLRGLGDVPFISVGPEDDIVDTFGHLTANYPCAIKHFAEAYAAEVPTDAPNSYLRRWQELAEGGRPDPEPEILKIMRRLAELFTCGDLHVSNGSAIRLVQRSQWAPTVRIESNRGVSGIEGSTSTAIGSAMVSERPTLLISGDMSAAYDVGALAIRGIPTHFKMAVLDNGGGDIFRNIATTRSLDELDEYFVMPPRFPIEALAAAYGFRYFTCSHASDRSIEDFMACHEAPAILHIHIDYKQSSGLI